MNDLSDINRGAKLPRQSGSNRLLSRIISAMKFAPILLSNKSAKTLFKYLTIPLALWLVTHGIAQAEDLTAAGKQDAQDTFGKDSTMMYYFMIAEVILVFIIYLKNHNPATFLLIPVFIVVTNIIFSIVAARSGGAY